MGSVAGGLAVGLVLVCLCTPASALASSPATPASSFSVSLTGQPTTGVIPFLVTFHAIASRGVASSFNWTFGDGTTFNGSSGDGSPTHRYDRPGTFAIAVVVAEGNQSASGTTVVRAVFGPLRASLIATPTTGSVPMTVHFLSNVSGGTETYLSVVWSFGTGDFGSGLSVNYTYSSAGRFLSQVRVTDTGEETATASTWVNVTVAPGEERAFWVTEFSSPFVLSALAIAIVAASVILFRSLTRRAPGTLRDGDRSVDGDVPSVASEPPAMVEVPMAGGLPPPPPDRPTSATLRVSERVLVHLLGEGRVGANEVAPTAISQAGIGGAVGVPQNALTHVLARLMAGGLVSSELRHVVGRGRRLKTYQLTPRGELLARRLWYQVRPGAPPGSIGAFSAAGRMSYPNESTRTGRG